MLEQRTAPHEPRSDAEGPETAEPGDGRTDTGGLVERFILSGPSSLLGALCPVLERDPTTSVIAASPRGAPLPDRLVVEMSPDRADTIRSAIGAAVSIEPDAPVAPAGGRG